MQRHAIDSNHFVALSLAAHEAHFSLLYPHDQGQEGKKGLIGFTPYRRRGYPYVENPVSEADNLVAFASGVKGHRNGTSIFTVRHEAIMPQLWRRGNSR